MSVQSLVLASGTRPKSMVIIQGHPDPASGHFCHALADAYAEGAIAAGYRVTRVDLALLDFPLLRTQQEFEKGVLPPMLTGARDAISSASHLVFVFPLWLGTMPALVKAFLEQIMRPGIGFAYRDKGLPKKLLAGRSARLIVTMGMPALAYRWFFLADGIRGFRRGILKFVGISPIRTTYIGTVQSLTEARARSLLGKMKVLGSTLD